LLTGCQFLGISLSTFRSCQPIYVCTPAAQNLSTAALKLESIVHELEAAIQTLDGTELTLDVWLAIWLRIHKARNSVEEARFLSRIYAFFVHLG